MVARDDLVACLDRAAERKVTIISAPAGSGKTSLLRAWANRQGRAHHIAFAEGRRGACRDYLANTAAHARALGINDPYIEELVQRVGALRDEYVIPTVLPNAEAVGEA